MQTKISSSELKIGMFVASLDRPWTDTPFIFQGFLIEHDEDIKQLQHYCAFVYVDWGRSPLPQSRQGLSATETAVKNQPLSSASQASIAGTISPPAGKSSDPPKMFEALAMPATTPSPKAKARTPPQNKTLPDRPLDESNVRDYSDQAGFFSGIAERMMGIFRGKTQSPQVSTNFKQQRPDLEEPAENKERPAFIPSGIELSMYVDARAVEEEIAPAVKAHQHANDVLNKLVQDIKSNKRFAIVETEAVTQEVVSSMVRNPDAMMWVARLRKQDELAYGHGLQVAVYLVALGRHLGLPKHMLDRLCLIGLLLDIGKIKLPNELLLKSGRLTSEEFETVKSHVQIALEILKETPDLHPDILLAIAQHHEREDGSGYPAGLSGNEISFFGRMSAIVDSFAALTNPRSYAEAMPAYEALQSLINFNPGLYQATMVEQFIQAIGVFPVGSMVELSSGEVAVVISHSKVRRLKPRVLIISDSNKLPSPQPITLDLLHQPVLADKSELIIQRGLPIGAFGLDPREYYLT